jgi:hypothetical protein
MTTRASIHFFLVKVRCRVCVATLTLTLFPPQSIERLVELCGRRDAALKKRCQETLGESEPGRQRRSPLAFFPLPRKARPGCTSRPVPTPQKRRLRCCGVSSGLWGVFSDSSLAAGIIKEVGQDIHQQ